jgi:lipid-A-disaccharide synthase
LIDRLSLVAGEASGDLLAAQMIAGLKAITLVDGLKLSGVGGPRLIEQGMQTWYPSEAMAVRGYAEVVKALPRLLRMRADIYRRVLAEKPKLFVGVDAPDFNLKLEQRLRLQGQKVVHFISPSIWAWRPQRIEQIRQSVDHMLLVFPFEKKIYDQAKVPATYVGHPLADVIALQPDRLQALLDLGLSPADQVIAVLPGSRKDELLYNLPTFLKAAQWLHQRIKNLVFVLPAANQDRLAQLKAMLAGIKLDPTLRLKITSGQSHQAMAACSTALVASGTATLEVALFKRPMVIAYKMHPWSYRWMRRKALLPYIGLPNILAGSMLVPEFVQDAATPEALGNALYQQLIGLEQEDEWAQRFTQMHHDLRRDCAGTSARQLLELAA